MIIVLAISIVTGLCLFTAYVAGYRDGWAEGKKFTDDRSEVR